MANIEHNSSSAEKATEYLVDQGIDADVILAEGLSRIKEIERHLQENKSKRSVFISTEKTDTPVSNYQKKNWTHKSVLKLMAESGTDDPLAEIKTRARNLVLKAFELGWEGPPYSPVQLAEIIGMDVIPNDSVVDARILPTEKGFQIQYNPFQRPTRINFSVSHEIAHTLFSDCGEAIRNREDYPKDNRELEQLCNAAPAEIQLPYAIFSHDANANHLVDHGAVPNSQVR